MKDRREYTKPTVTRVNVEPSESVLFNCKENEMACLPVSTYYGS